jgi:hypothetical protein
VDNVFQGPANRLKAVGSNDAVARLKEKRRTLLLQNGGKRYEPSSPEYRSGGVRAAHISRQAPRLHDGARFRRPPHDQPRDAKVLVGIGADGGSKLLPDISNGTTSSTNSLCA